MRIGAFSYDPKPSGDTVNDLRGRKPGCSSAPPGQIDFTTALTLPGVAGEQFATSVAFRASNLRGKELFVAPRGPGEGR